MAAAVPWPFQTNSNSSNEHATIRAKQACFSPLLWPSSHQLVLHSPQADTLAQAGTQILTFHHEGFFWRCWFFGEGQSATIWTFWYSEYLAMLCLLVLLPAWCPCTLFCSFFFFFSFSLIAHLGHYSWVLFLGSHWAPSHRNPLVPMKISPMKMGWWHPPAGSTLFPCTMILVSSEGVMNLNPCPSCP